MRFLCEGSIIGMPLVAFLDYCIHSGLITFKNIIGMRLLCEGSIIGMPLVAFLDYCIHSGLITFKNIIVKREI